MARPSFAENDCTARDRIIDILSESTETRLSVIEICRRTRVNKNTFYYHFESIEDLIQQLLDETLDAKLATAILTSATDNIEYATIGDLSVEKNAFGKVCIMAASSNPFITGKLKTSIHKIWCNVLGVEYLNPGEYRKRVLEFPIPGAISIMGVCCSCGTTTLKNFISILQKPFFKNTMVNMYNERCL